MKLNETLILSVDDFITDTRVHVCMADTCKFYDKKTGECALKAIMLNGKGGCVYYEFVG